MHSQITDGGRQKGKCYAKFVDPENLENLDTTISIYYVLTNGFPAENINLKKETFSIDLKSELWIRAFKNSSYKVLWELDKQSVGSKTVKYLNRKNRKKLDPNIVDTIQI